MQLTRVAGPKTASYFCICDLWWQCICGPRMIDLCHYSLYICIYPTICLVSHQPPMHEMNRNCLRKMNIRHTCEVFYWRVLSKQVCYSFGLNNVTITLVYSIEAWLLSLATPFFSFQKNIKYICTQFSLFTSHKYIIWFRGKTNEHIWLTKRIGWSEKTEHIHIVFFLFLLGCVYYFALLSDKQSNR